MLKGKGPDIYVPSFLRYGLVPKPGRKYELGSSASFRAEQNQTVISSL
jgi:hypothetical protein